MMSSGQDTGISDMRDKARILSSFIVCVAYFVTLHVDTTIGARIYIVGNALALPYMVKHRCWDLVALLVFFIVVGLPKVFA
jgi:hypothetical protein